MAEARDGSAEEAAGELRERLAACQGRLRDAVWELVGLHSRAGRPAVALGHLERLLEDAPEPGERARILFGTGQLREQLSDFAGAAEAYAQALRLEPADRQVWYFLHNNLGYCLTTLGRHVEAEDRCRQAVAIDPARHNAHKNLGLALQGQGRLAEAARSFLIARDRCPEDTRAARHLMLLLEAHPEVGRDLPGPPAGDGSCP